MTQQESIEEKLIRMIDNFRTEFEKLAPEEKTKEQMINSLKEPCQIFVLSSPENSFHLLIKTHIENLDDKQISLHPLHYESFLEKLEEFAKNPLWGEVILEGEEMSVLNFNQSIENIIVNFGKRIVKNLRIESKSSHIGGQALHNNKLAEWDLVGKLSEIDFDSFTINCVKGYKESYKQFKNTETKQIKETIPDKNTGLGTYFYPPLLIGDFKPSIQQRIQHQEYRILNENVVESNFYQNVMVITRGGLIGIESREKELVEKILTTIMSVAITFGVPLQAINSSELAEITFDNKTHEIRGSSWSSSTKRMDMFFSMDSERGRVSDPRRLISVNDLKKILTASEKIISTDEHIDLLKLLISSYTHFINGDYSQSFITSWTIIERNIYDLWMRKLLSAKISKRIRDDLDRWDLYRVLEILHLDKIIPNDEYIELKSLQGLRNDVIHEGHEITQRTAEKCFNLALDDMKNKIGVHEKIKTKQAYI